MRFMINVADYLGSGTRQVCGSLIRSYRFPIESCHFADSMLLFVNFENTRWSQIFFTGSGSLKTMNVVGEN